MVDRTDGIPLVAKNSALRGVFLRENEFEKRFFRHGREVEFQRFAHRQPNDFARVVVSHGNAFVEIIGRYAVDGMDYADKVLFEKPFRLIMYHHVMEHVEQFRMRNLQSQFLVEFTDNRLFMAFAMVDPAAGQIEFSDKRSTGLTGKHYATVG